MAHYGAKDAGEFFAVATGSFFEQPERLSKEHPALYAALRDYYRVDPRRMALIRWCWSDRPTTKERPATFTCDPGGPMS